MSPGEWISLAGLMLVMISGGATICWKMIVAQRAGDSDLWERLNQLEREVSACRAELVVFKEFREDQRELLKTWKRAP